jgi:hypothetical protein
VVGVEETETPENQPPSSRFPAEDTTEGELRDRAREAFAVFSLSPVQKRTVWRCLQESVEGTFALANAVLNDPQVYSPRGVLMFRLLRRQHIPRKTGWRIVRGQGGESLLEDPEGTDPAPRKTGWRWVTGTHSGTFVEDPEGTDRPPPGYFSA